jgi:uncharacterized protein YceK
VKLLLLTILIALSGCATVSTAPVVSDYCRIAAPISYDSANDTAETVAEIEAHNSKWVCVCENDCPKNGVAQ